MELITVLLISKPNLWMKFAFGLYFQRSIIDDLPGRKINNNFVYKCNHFILANIKIIMQNSKALVIKNTAHFRHSHRFCWQAAETQHDVTAYRREIERRRKGLIQKYIMLMKCIICKWTCRWQLWCLRPLQSSTQDRILTHQYFIGLKSKP